LNTHHGIWSELVYHSTIYYRDVHIVVRKTVDKILETTGYAMFLTLAVSLNSMNRDDDLGIEMLGAGG
jgi:carbamoylphosphate synthase large subunit